jgi:hypothetical protein
MKTQFYTALTNEKLELNDKVVKNFYVKSDIPNRFCLEIGGQRDIESSILKYDEELNMHRIVFFDKLQNLFCDNYPEYERLLFFYATYHHNIRVISTHEVQLVVEYYPIKEFPLDVQNSTYTNILYTYYTYADKKDRKHTDNILCFKLGMGGILYQHCGERCSILDPKHNCPCGRFDLSKEYAQKIRV